MDSDFVRLVLDLLPHIQKIDSRDLCGMLNLLPRKGTHLQILSSGLSNRIDLHSEFESFSVEEHKAWSDSGCQPEKDSCLVSPSGSLDSNISHHLHQPSFTTKSVSSENIAEPSNGCIAMVMGNAFEEGESLLFDHIHRRAHTSDGLITYPESIIMLHENFTRRIIGSSAAKVEIVYGDIIQSRILHTMRGVILPLWGQFSGVTMVLVQEDNFHNAEEGFRFRKAMLWATHPQRFFYEQQRSPITIRQDLVFKAAFHIVNFKLSLDPDYFKSKHWTSKTPSAYQLGLIRAEMYRRSLSSRQGLPLQDFEDTVEDRERKTAVAVDFLHEDGGEWDEYFNQHPHSNERTKNLLPAAIEATNLAITSDLNDWHHPSEFPPAVLEWFKGQKETLFYYGSVSSPNDIEIAFENCVDTQPIENQKIELSNGRQLRYMMHQLMLQQQGRLNLKRTAIDDFIYSRIDGSEIKTVCPCGAFKDTDRDPRFSCAQVGAYVVRLTRRCNCAKSRTGGYCQLWPVMPGLVGIRSDRSSLRAEKRHEDSTPSRALIRKKGEGSSRPKVVELWCIQCRENTQVQGSRANKEGNMFIDNDAEWTLGKTRPLYCVRASLCRTCSRTTFVPVDSTIPFITPCRLRRFFADYGKYDTVVKESMLDTLISSRQAPRSSVAR